MERFEGIDEERLQDFLDGRLDREARREFVGILREHPHDALQILELLANDRALHRLGQAMLTSEIPERLTNLIETARSDSGDAARRRARAGPAMRRRRTFHAVLGPIAASLLFVIGLGLGWYGYDRLVPRLNDSDIAYNDAMTAFSFYTEDPASPIQYSHEQLDALLPRVRDALGRELAPPDLLGQGFEFFAARLLPGVGGQAVLYLYQNVSDPADRIGIYVWRIRADGRRSAPQSRDGGQFVSRSWDDNVLGYTLLSTPRERNLDLLEGDIRKQFPPPSGPDA